MKTRARRASRPTMRISRAPVRVILLLASLASLPGAASPALAPSPSLGTVVLLHGFGRSAGSMALFEEALAKRGYAVHNLQYPWRKAGVEALADLLAAEVARCCDDPRVPVHFVAHSMGGILVRAYLDEGRPANLGRVVMLAPPNHGSEWVDALRDLPLFVLAGPAAAELGTDPDGVARRLPPVDFELGVLIGNRSWNPLGSWLLPGDDDGTVSHASARIDGMRDFRVVPENHTFILSSPDVVWEAIHFLEHGEFTQVQRGSER